MTGHTQRSFASVAVGERFELAKEPVSTMQLVKYAGASGDYNRIHYDLPFAEAAGLGGVIAHGMLTMGFLGQLLTDWAGPSALVTGLSARFVKPVQPGDVVRLSGVVRDKSDAQSGSMVECELEGHTDRGQVIVARATVRLPDGG